MIARRSLAALAALAGVLLLGWQAASVALFGTLGRVPSVPQAAAAGWPFAAADALGLDRLPTVRVELARAAVLRGDDDRAARLLAGLPVAGSVADLTGQLALAAGRPADAVAAFAVAGDIVRARAPIAAAAAHDAAAGEVLAAAFARTAAAAGAPADVVAEAEWRAGDLAAAVARDRPAQAPQADARARRDYAAAVRDDPTQETYWLSDGLMLLAGGDAEAARVAYARAVALVPDSVDALVGQALADARSGDCAAALAALARAQRDATQQGRAIDPFAAGYDAPTRRALERCAHGDAAPQ